MASDIRLVFAHQCMLCSLNAAAAAEEFMPISQMFLPEFDEEMKNTRKLLERVPENRFGYQPHQKSMTLGRLAGHRSEEHTSELQSRLHLVCRLLLEKKKHQPTTPSRSYHTHHPHLRQLVLT